MTADKRYGLNQSSLAHSSPEFVKTKYAGSVGVFIRGYNDLIKKDFFGTNNKDMIGMDEIKNKVSESGIVTIDLENFYVDGERVIFDIKQVLFQGLILKEKEFREFIKSTDWSFYQNKIVGICCSVDAIVPTWAYMLLSIAIEPFAAKLFFGTLNDIENFLFIEKISQLDIKKYINDNELYNDIKLYGNQSKEIVKQAFQKSHFLVFISKSEGWPKVVAESMFWSCLPVSTKVSCIPYMLDYGNRGALINDNLDEVIEKISESYADVPEGEKLALFNSAGFLEIAINKGNAAGLLGLKGFSEKNTQSKQILQNQLYYQHFRWQIHLKLPNNHY